MVNLVTDYCKHGDINKFIEKNHKSPKKLDNIEITGIIIIQKNLCLFYLKPLQNVIKM